MDVTYVDICKGSRGDEADVDREEGICVALASKLEATGRSVAVNGWNGPGEGVPVCAPIGFSSDRWKGVGSALVNARWTGRLTG